MSSKIGIVIEREYLERVKKKSFIITTILMPLLMLALMLMPAFILSFVDGSENNVLVIDNTNIIAPQLTDRDDVKFTQASPLVTVDSALRNQDYTAVLVIPKNIIETKRQTLKLYTDGASPLVLESTVTGQVNKIIEDERLKKYDIANLDAILEDVSSDVVISNLRKSEEGEEEAMGAGVSYGLGVGMSFVLYMFLLIYGQMVMTSIIEEKGNRVLEVVVTSVKPIQLMMGKIIGVALVAVTQMLLWGVVLTALSAFVLPAVIPAETAADVAAVQAGNMSAVSDTESLDMIKAVAALSNVGSIVGIFSLLTLFLTLGFLVYSSIFAAVGSMVDNIQDSSQFTSFAVFPIIFGLIFAMIAAADPMGPVAFWTSIFPLTAPMVMVARIPAGIPGWEIALSLVLLVLTFVAVVWLAGKIYRVGIFMYGKKPTLKEVAKWISYK